LVLADKHPEVKMSPKLVGEVLLIPLTVLLFPEVQLFFALDEPNSLAAQRIPDLSGI
jgi:hypothetical protein